MYNVYTVRPINNTPRRPVVSRRAESACPPEVTWERAMIITGNLITLPVLVGLCSLGAWGKEVGCKRVFHDLGHCTCRTKQKCHRPGFRQGIGALPLLLLPWKLRSYCSRLMYTAIYTQANALDRMLMSISLKQLGKLSSQSSWNLKFSEMCAIRLN